MERVEAIAPNRPGGTVASRQVNLGALGLPSLRRALLAQPEDVGSVSVRIFAEPHLLLRDENNCWVDREGRRSPSTSVEAGAIILDKSVLSEFATLTGTLRGGGWARGHSVVHGIVSGGAVVSGTAVVEKFAELTNKVKADRGVFKYGVYDTQSSVNSVENSFDTKTKRDAQPYKVGVPSADFSLTGGGTL